jgi:hypothetical protein
MYIPDGVLTTGCVRGCSSRITWEYEQGEPMTRDHPGTDDEVWPAMGCNEDHLIALTYSPEYDSVTSTVWYQVGHYHRMLDAAHARYLASLRHLAGVGGTVILGTRRSLSGPVTITYLVPDPNADNLDDYPF